MWTDTAAPPRASWQRGPRRASSALRLSLRSLHCHRLIYKKTVFLNRTESYSSSQLMNDRLLRWQQGFNVANHPDCDHLSDIVTSIEMSIYYSYSALEDWWDLSSNYRTSCYLLIIFFCILATSTNKFVACHTRSVIKYVHHTTCGLFCGPASLWCGQDSCTRCLPATRSAFENDASITEQSERVML